ncbi:calcium-binding protein [Celeribacter sp.]|uniref:calcium-binding protein n=1 Tax=Celeribacter sp. TaxID=1890673 RepID=UPI003A8EBA2D
MGTIGIIDGTSGNDTVSATFIDLDGDAFTSGDNDVSLGDGNDQVTYTQTASQTLTVDAGAGNDRITTYRGSLIADGGAGDDSFTLYSMENALLTGGTGADSFNILTKTHANDSTVTITDFDAATDQITFKTDTIDVMMFAAGEVQTGIAGFGVTQTLGGLELTTSWINQYSQESQTATVLLAGFGVIDGTSGDDLVNRSYADRQGDAFTGDTHLVNLGGGDDRFVGGIGDNEVHGGDGNDMIKGVSNNNTLFGEAGDDVIYSGRHTSVLDGGDGDDHLILQLDKGADHTATGGTGADTFEISRPSNGRQSTVTITDFDIAEDSLVLGGITIDITQDGARYSVVTGADDRFIYFNDDDVIVLEGLGNGTPADVANGSVEGSAFNDIMVNGYTDFGGDTVSGGDDLIFGLGGDDLIRGGDGDDEIYGGDGNDALYGSNGHNMIYGEAGDDLLNAGKHGSDLYGGTGDDTLEVNLSKNGTHRLNGGDGADTFVFTSGSGGTRATVIVTDFDVTEDSVSYSGNTQPFGYIGGFDGGYDGPFDGIFDDVFDGGYDGPYGSDFDGWTETGQGLVLSYLTGGEIIFEGLTYQDAYDVGLFDIIAVG